MSQKGLFTWPNQDDRMNLTESWQPQTLSIEHDQNWNQQPIETDEPFFVPSSEETSFLTTFYGLYLK